jgi:hypothetical protein
MAGTMLRPKSLVMTCLHSCHGNIGLWPRGRAEDPVTLPQGREGAMVAPLPSLHPHFPLQPTVRPAAGDMGFGRCFNQREEFAPAPSTCRPGCHLHRPPPLPGLLLLSEVSIPSQLLATLDQIPFTKPPDPTSTPSLCNQHPLPSAV